MATGEIKIMVEIPAIDDLTVVLSELLEKVDGLATQADVDALAGRLDAATSRIMTGQQAVTSNVAELAQAVTDLRAEFAALANAAPAALDLSALGDKVGAVEAAATAINTSVGELTGGVDAAQQLAAGEAPPPAP